MKCLTVRQPYADLIAHGEKDVENRTWNTHHRGPLLIHAGLSIDREFERELRAWWQREQIETPLPNPFPTGCIVGIVTLADVVTEHDSTWFNGPFGWVLTEPRVFATPVAYTGRLGLYDIPDALVREAISSALSYADE